MKKIRLELHLLENEVQELGDRVLDIIGNVSKCDLSPYEIGEDILDMLDDYNVVDMEVEDSP